MLGKSEFWEGTSGKDKGGEKREGSIEGGEVRRYISYAGLDSSTCTRLEGRRREGQTGAGKGREVWGKQTSIFLKKLMKIIYRVKARGTPGERVEGGKSSVATEAGAYRDRRQLLRRGGRGLKAFLRRRISPSMGRGPYEDPYGEREGSQ